MENNFHKVKDFVLDLGYTISNSIEEDQIIIINDEASGIKNCAIGCADPILIIEQYLLELNSTSSEVFQSLLMKNRDIIHGAFVLDESGKKVIFRDTLQIMNLDKNELEGSLNSLSLLLSEYSDELIKFSRN
ncbi:molecular chaperone Tir [Kordia sp. YSTF-M3]|uniref:Molecular chaperone Tir n=1 Tax=Kordia aestuariivivens TaxID=2759037 RepID=A0ABR7Q6K1_9FLAO|nr:molecular chaperone Tir [Kordia aestuariivivens]MBC8754073.1 molecular chaperone Tir [Kordia aestuariivivens]